MSKSVTTTSYTQAGAEDIWDAGADLIGYVPSVTIAPVILAICFHTWLRAQLG